MWLQKTLKTALNRALLRDKDGCLYYVNSEAPVRKPEELRAGASAWLIDQFCELAIPEDSPMTPDVLFQIMLSERREINQSPELQNLLGIADLKRVPLWADPSSVHEVLVLGVPDLSELSDAIDAGLTVPTWIMETPSRSYEAAWIMIRRHDDMKRRRRPENGKNAADSLGWVEVVEPVNPVNSRNRLRFIDTAGGFRSAQSVVKSAAKAAEELPELRRKRRKWADRSNDVTDELRTIRGKAGGQKTSERKAVSSRRNLAPVTEDRRARKAENAVRARRLRADHWPVKEIAAYLEVNDRTVYRYLNGDG